MGAISGWILSIVGVVLLGVIIDIILPEGQVSKYIRGVVCLATVLVIISPLAKLGNKDFNIKNYISTEIELDEGMLVQINQSKAKNIEQSLEKLLQDKGYENIDVSISADYYSAQMEITAIFVDLSKTVLNGESVNINKYEEITSLIVESLGVEEECVLIYV